MPASHGNTSVPIAMPGALPRNACQHKNSGILRYPIAWGVQGYLEPLALTDDVVERSILEIKDLEGRDVVS